MTDRELLEAAAKAAGIELKPHPNGKLFRDLHFINVAERRNWNPLTDDGDALRLAVKLNLIVRCYENNIIVDGGGISVKESVKPCIYAATRRAIVMAAAAEIGKTL
jgi:hypothetical protein